MRTQREEGRDALRRFNGSRQHRSRCLLGGGKREDEGRGEERGGRKRENLVERQEVTGGAVLKGKQKAKRRTKRVRRCQAWEEWRRVAADVMRW